jgi:hypothetical protein
MKITTVVPAYKSRYLMELLASLVQQEEPPDQVIFSDDTADFQFAQVLYAEPIKSMVAHLNVTVVEGPKRGAHANWAHCVNAWGARTELLHILCDDDIVYPHFYQQHRRAHLAGTFSSTISRRWYANEAGRPIRMALEVPEVIASHPKKMHELDARTLFSSNVARGANWLGEVSNTVMRAETALLVRDRQFASIGFAGLEDLGAFVCGAVENPICFINEHLGFFRVSPDQNSSQTMGMPLKLAHLAYIALAIIGRNTGHLSQAETQFCIDKVGPAFLWNYRDETDVLEMREFLPELIGQTPGSEARFLAMWESFTNPVATVLSGA